MKNLKVSSMEDFVKDKSQNKDGNEYNQRVVDILALKRLKVLNEFGEQVRLSTFWDNNTVIFIFVRHFSCIACRAHVDKIWRQRAELEKKKTRIVFIGNGAPSFIGHFKEEMNVQDAEIYTDPSLEVFDACRLNRSALKLLSIKSAAEMMKLKKQGYSQGKWDTDSGIHRQMGGVVAIKHPGKVVYHFVANYLGDFDNPEDWPQE